MARKKGVPNVKKKRVEGDNGGTPDGEDAHSSSPDSPVGQSPVMLYESRIRASTAGTSVQSYVVPPQAVNGGDKPLLPPGLDLFAEVYVPAWLRAVNEAPAPFVPRSQAESLRVSPGLSVQRATEQRADIQCAPATNQQRSSHRLAVSAQAHRSTSGPRSPAPSSGAGSPHKRHAATAWNRARHIISHYPCTTRYQTGTHTDVASSRFARRSSAIFAREGAEDKAAAIDGSEICRVLGPVTARRVCR